MAKMVITDDDGTTYESGQFIAVLLQEEGQVLGMAEDGRLSQESRLGFLIQGQKLLGELAGSINPEEDVTENPLQGKEVIDV